MPKHRVLLEGNPSVTVVETIFYVEEAYSIEPCLCASCNDNLFTEMPHKTCKILENVGNNFLFSKLINEQPLISTD